MEAKSRGAQSIWGRYLVTTVCIMLVMWGGLIAAQKRLGLAYGTFPFMALYMLGGFSPTIAALFWIRKKNLLSWKEIIKAIFGFRQKLWLYAAAIGLALVQILVPLVMGRAEAVGAVYWAVLSLPLMLFGGGLEEVGWRWVLQPALEQKMPFIPATMITAAIWSLWHLPLFLIEGVTQYGMPYASFVIMVFGLAFALAAIYRISNSVWLCIVLHSFANALNGWIQPQQDLITMGITAAVVISLSLLLLLLWRKANTKHKMDMHE